MKVSDMLRVLASSGLMVIITMSRGCNVYVDWRMNQNADDVVNNVF